MKKEKDLLPVLILIYKDENGEIDYLVTSKASEERIFQVLESSKFISIEGEGVNCYNVKKVREPRNLFEKHFFNLDKLSRWKLLRKGVEGHNKFKNIIESGQFSLSDIEDMYGRLECKPEKTLEEKIAEARAGDDFYN